MTSRAATLITRTSVVTISPETKRILCVVLAALAIIAPAIVWGIPSNRDLFNHFRFALPFYDSLTHGQPFPRWLAESNSGYGDASFRFYPPALYYLLAFARTLTNSWYPGTLLTISLLSIVGCLGVYFWASSLLTRTEAMWAAILYAVAPYRVNDIYLAFLFAEYAAIAVLPFAFGFVERLCKHPRRRDVAGLAATYALLILTNLPLTIIGSFALLIYALFRIPKAHRINTIIKLSAAVALALMASSIFWIKLISELSWINIAAANAESSVYYTTNFVFSTFSSANLNVWWMNILTAMTLLLFAPAIIFLNRRTRALAGFGQLRGVIALIALALIMATPISRLLWHAIPMLQQVQFPWRWLTILSMAGCVFAARAISFWASAPTTQRRALKLLVFGCVSLSIAFTLGHIVREAEYKNGSEFASALQSVRGSPSINYWLPAGASAAPREMPQKVDAGGRSVSVERWNEQERIFRVSDGAAIEARVRTFYYPHWIATSGNRLLATRPDTDGALLVSVPAAASTIKLEFREPKKVQLAILISSLTWLLIPALGLTRRKG
jgi:6-pyruvoyl-tetrahydropterin synthase related domain